MTNRRFLFPVLCALCFGVSAWADGEPQVNLFVGTANDYGQMSPGATVPFGMVQVCPDSKPRQHPGYDFEVPTISGISVNRLSGVGGSGCGGNVSVLPLISATAAAEGEVLIDKASEQAVPGYYAARLSNGVQVGLSATSRMAVERYVFPAGCRPTLLVNPRSSFERVHASDFRVLDERTAAGYIESRNTCGRGRYHLYYRIFSNRPFAPEMQEDGMAALRFASSADNTVELRIVLSTGLEEQLTRVSEKMVWSQSFEQVRADAARQWTDVLSRASVTGGTADERTMFYTSLYRVMHSPFLVTDDVLTEYMGTDGKAHTAFRPYYSSWSLWDTYRTKFPLIALLQPERSRDIMWSLAQLYITGKQDWSTPFECVPTVRTEHAIATLLDALRKGLISASDLRPSYAGMVAEALRLPLRSPDQCLEAASDFWALGQLAHELGHTADGQRFAARGEQLFDSIWPREFMRIDDSYTKMKGNGLYQGTRWQYRWGAPMYLDRMARLCGRSRLASQLETFFREQLYNQGNEPDIHVPFLFGRLGKPARTGIIVRELALDSTTHRYGGNDAYPTPFVGHAFRNAPRGYCPEMDEDDGTMSAWFVFASLGLYPLVVGEPQYELFSPLFDSAELRLGDGGMTKTVIRTSGRRDAKQPLRRVTWNGRRLRDFRIQHSELVKGGELVFWY